MNGWKSLGLKVDDDHHLNLIIPMDHTHILHLLSPINIQSLNLQKPSRIIPLMAHMHQHTLPFP